MEALQLFYKDAQISYYRFGVGPQVVVCFHGYGEAATTFSFLEKHGGQQFTFYAIDLPYHGKTEWKKGAVFLGDDLKKIVEQITGFNSPFSDKIYLVGYSLGGRMCLHLYQSMPEQISKLVLLAPDGLKVNFWYWLATQTWAGNKLFALTMKKPGWFFGMLKLLNKLKLVNASIFKFVNFYIGNKEVRQQLYTRWTALRKIKPRLPLIKLLVKEQGASVRLLYGKHDRIILSAVGEKFRKGIEASCTISVINAGHQVLQERYAGEIMEKLLA